MQNLLNRRRDQCERLQDLLKSSAADVLVASIEKLVESLPGEGRAHFADCRRCRKPCTICWQLVNCYWAPSHPRRMEGRGSRSAYCRRSQRANGSWLSPRAPGAWCRDSLHGWHGHRPSYLWLEAPGCIKGPRQVRSGSRLRRLRRNICSKRPRRRLVRTMCLSAWRRETNERSVGDSKSGPLGWRCFPAGSGAGRDAGIRVRAPHGDGRADTNDRDGKEGAESAAADARIELSAGPAEAG